MRTPKSIIVPPWLAVAYRELGIKEIPGPGSHTRIDEYLAVVGMPSDDSIAWCAAFVGWSLETTGNPSTKKPNARSYLTWGIPLTHLRYGAIVILWRVSLDSWQGHAGFGLGLSPDASQVYLLGGNQSDEVNVTVYPANTILGYRWPKGDSVAH